MKDVSEKQGRTVLFVSHNLQSIASLSSKLISLSNGYISSYNNPYEGIHHYFKNEVNTFNLGDEKIYLQTNDESPIKVLNYFLVENGYDLKSSYTNQDDLNVIVEFEIHQINPDFILGIAIYNLEGVNIIWSIHSENNVPIELKIGKQKICIKIPLKYLNVGGYQIELIAGIHNKSWIFQPRVNSPVLHFSIHDSQKRKNMFANNRPSILEAEVQYFLKK